MTVAVGEQIQAGTGTWTGTPTSYAYQWQDSVDGVTVNDTLSGATRSDYIVGVADIGRFLRVVVTASNAGGSSDVAYSDWAGPIWQQPSTPPRTSPSPGGSNLPGGTTVYLPRKRASKTGYKKSRKTGFKRRRT